MACDIQRIVVCCHSSHTQVYSKNKIHLKKKKLYPRPRYITEKWQQCGTKESPDMQCKVGKGTAQKDKIQDILHTVQVDPLNTL